MVSVAKYLLLPLLLTVLVQVGAVSQKHDIQNIEQIHVSSHEFELYLISLSDQSIIINYKRIKVNKQSVNS